MTDQSGPIDYVVTCLFGLEEALADEVHERLNAAAERHWCEVAFSFDGNPLALKELRIALNVFLQFDAFPVGHTVPDLAALESRVRQLPMEPWLRRWEQLSGGEPASDDICVSVKRKGEHNFSYRDVENLALDALPEATGRRAVLDPRPLELRIDINGRQCRLLGRLTAVPLSPRAHKRYHAPNETDASLAAAMVRYADPRPDGVFLDPFCGTGTIPIERAAWGPVARICGGDVSAKRVSWAAANAAGAGAQVLFGLWDAGRLPFRNRTFTRIVTNPPQSDPRTGRPWRGRDFAALIGESLRVLDYGGIAVWFLRPGRKFENAIQRLPHARVSLRRACSWKGKPCFIYVVRKEL